MNEIQIDAMIKEHCLNKQKSREIVIMRGGDKAVRIGFTRLVLVDEAGELKLEVYISGLSFIIYIRMIESYDYLPKTNVLCLFLK